MCAHKTGHVPRGTISVLKAFGHLAGWATLYSIGVTLTLAEILDRPIGLLGLLYVTLCAHGGYLLDRVKFRDRDLDPADLMADHDRHTYLRKHAPRIRVVMALDWIGALIVGVLISPALGILVLCGIGAGYVYSGWRPAEVGGRTRLKDVIGLKAILVSGAVVGLGIAPVLAGIYESDRPLAYPEFGVLMMTIVGMGLIVFGDAVICDLDDRESDDLFGTMSVPVLFGVRRAGVIGMLVLVIGSGVLWYSATGSSRIAALVFGGFVVLSGLGVLVFGPWIGGRRDWIDGRMMVACLLLMTISGVKFL
jgi:4-hydroxybenzoate polyprenyltransferase